MIRVINWAMLWVARVFGVTRALHATRATHPRTPPLTSPLSPTYM